MERESVEVASSMEPTNKVSCRLYGDDCSIRRRLLVVYPAGKSLCILLTEIWQIGCSQQSCRRKAASFSWLASLERDEKLQGWMRSPSPWFVELGQSRY